MVIVLRCSPELWPWDSETKPFLGLCASGVERERRGYYCVTVYCCTVRREYPSVWAILEILI